MNCSNCGAAPQSSTDRFCRKCGVTREPSKSTGEVLAPAPPPHETSSAKRGPKAGAIAAIVAVVAVAALACAVVFLTNGPKEKAASASQLPSSSDASGTSSAGTSFDEATPDDTTSEGTASDNTDSDGAVVDPSQSAAVAVSAVVPAQAPDGVDGAGNATNYDPANMLDSDDASAWRMKGDGANGEITITLDGSETVTSLGIINGYAKTDPVTGADRYNQERRITSVTWIFDDGTTIEQDLNVNDESMQTIDLDTPELTGQVVLRLGATTKPGNHKFNYTAISELDVEGQ